MNTPRESLYQEVITTSLSNAQDKYGDFSTLLTELQKFNLLCDNEVRYFYENDFFDKNPNEFLHDIQQRVLYHRLEEHKIMNGKVKKGGFIKVANGSRVQGTVHVGGLQPDYIIDTKSSEITNFLNQVKLRTMDKTLEEKIDIIGNIVREFIDKTEYTDQAYLELLEQYRTKEIEIPLSEYLKIRKGVCREISLLSIIGLNHIGIESYYYYVKVNTVFNKQSKDEDHAVVIVNKDNQLFVIDNYFRAFNNQKFEDLQNPNGVDVLSGLMYDSESIAQKGKAKIIMSRLYPENKHNNKYI